MKAAPNPREVIGGKRFRCDTKQGKKCEPLKPNWSWEGSRCKHCRKPMTKPMRD